jgi:membrane protein DedA with SNARE-associated domain
MCGTCGWVGAKRGVEAADGRIMLVIIIIIIIIIVVVVVVVVVVRRRRRRVWSSVLGTIPTG